MRRNRAGPDPVSCRSCRSKKLKCNRVQPCSNCVARGITCNFLVPPQDQSITTSTVQSNAELLARIERLESIVIKQTDSTETRSRYALDDSHTARQQTLHPTPENIDLPSIDIQREQVSRLLENVGTREDSLVCDSTSALFELHVMY